MSKRTPVSMQEFRKRLRAEKMKLRYSALERRYQINRWYLWKIINEDDYTPPEWAQERLGIRVYRPAPVCLRCGKIHVTKRCTDSAPDYFSKPIFDTPTRLLRWMLDNRLEI